MCAMSVIKKNVELCANYKLCLWFWQEKSNVFEKWFKSGGGFVQSVDLNVLSKTAN